MEDRPRIAITMGEPAGIGPEIIVKTFQDPSIYGFSYPFVVGDAIFLNESGFTVKIRTIYQFDIITTRIILHTWFYRCIRSEKYF